MLDNSDNGLFGEFSVNLRLFPSTPDSGWVGVAEELVGNIKPTDDRIRSV